MFSIFESTTSIMSNWKLCNFITSGKLTPTPKNFAHGFYSKKLTKTCYKNRGEVSRFFKALPLSMIMSKYPNNGCGGTKRQKNTVEN